MAYHPIPGPSSGSSSSSGFQYMNSPFGDATYTKVFVGGLAWETQSETMRRYFEQFGEILEAVVITDKNTGRSKGYGFVSVNFFSSFLRFLYLCCCLMMLYYFAFGHHCYSSVNSDKLVQIQWRHSLML